jgi:hypothetical protein
VGSIIGYLIAKRGKRKPAKTAIQGAFLGGLAGAAFELAETRKEKRKRSHTAYRNAGYESYSEDDSE